MKREFSILSGYSNVYSFDPIQFWSESEDKKCGWHVLIFENFQIMDGQPSILVGNRVTVTTPYGSVPGFIRSFTSENDSGPLRVNGEWKLSSSETCHRLEVFIFSLSEARILHSLSDGDRVLFETGDD